MRAKGRGGQVEVRASGMLRHLTMKRIQGLMEGTVAYVDNCRSRGEEPFWPTIGLTAREIRRLRTEAKCYDCY